ncbi:MAG: hypothetical protein ACKO9W_04080, partial [Bacteroidota bacterium]
MPALTEERLEMGSGERVLGLTLETEMPGWLGLSSHVQEDRAFLNSLLSNRSNEGRLQTVPSSSEDWSKFYKK